MKRALTTFLLLCCAAVEAFAQTGVPYFPQTLPGQTVVGRRSAQPGATEAIPFAFFASSITAAIQPFSSILVQTNTSATTPVLKIEQQGSGDAALTFLLTGGTQWTAGIDNSDSDKFKISYSGALGTSDALRIDTSGNSVLPSGNLTLTAGNLTLSAGSLNSPAATQALSITPIANATTTLSSLSIIGSRVSPNTTSATREFLVNVGLNSTVGRAGIGAAQDGVGLYTGVVADTNSGDVWGQNIDLQLKSTLNNAINAQGFEIDFDNNYADYTSLSPIAAGLSISGAGTHKSSAAISVAGTISGAGNNPIWTYGLSFSGKSVSDFTILDSTQSSYSLYINGTKANGIDMASATISGNAFASPGFSVTGVGALRVTAATAGLGYGTGSGGTVTQATSKSTTVVLNKSSGAITLNNAALASATIVSFTLTNSAIGANDVLVINHISAGTAGAYTFTAQCASGSAVIAVRNATAGSLSEAIVLQYVVIKGVVS